VRDPVLREAAEALGARIEAELEAAV